MKSPDLPDFVLANRSELRAAWHEEGVVSRVYAVEALGEIEDSTTRPYVDPDRY